MKNRHKTLLQTQVFNVIEKQSLGEKYALIENRDWANTLAFDKNGFLSLVEQSRYGGEYETLEPAGGIVDFGKSPIETAKAELSEELGLISKNWHLVGSFMPNPGLMNNSCHCFLCFDAIEMEQWEPPLGERRVLIEPCDLKSWVFETLPLHGLVLATALLAAKSSEVITNYNPEWGRAFRDIGSSWP